MKCDDLMPHVDGKTGLFSRLNARMHRACCAGCRRRSAEWLRLSGGISLLEGEPVPPALTDRLMADAMAAADESRSNTASPRLPQPRAQGAFPMRRRLVALALAAITIAVGFGLLPHMRGNTALAQVARAMANVKSAHAILYSINPSTGERENTELWIERPSRVLVRSERGGEHGELADDGKRVVQIDTSDGICSATISPSKGLPRGVPALSWFGGRELLEESMMSGMEMTRSRSTTLPDGTKARVLDLRGAASNTVVTIDESTNLLLQMEEYCAGKLRTRIERVEYDVDPPDSLFEPAIPKNAIVVDLLHPQPASSEVKAWRKAVVEALPDADTSVICIGIRDGHCGSGFHTGMRFAPMDSDGISVYYRRSGNRYLILGKALITDTRMRGYRRVVQDREVRAPYPPDRLPGTLVMRIDRPGDCREFLLPYDDPRYHWFCVEQIQNVGDGPFIIMDEPALRIYGEGKVLPSGVILHDGKMVSWPDIRHLGLYRDLAKPDFGDLPDSEVSSMKAEMAKHDRAEDRYTQNCEAIRRRLPSDAIPCGNQYPGERAQLGSGYHPGLDFFPDPEVGMALFYSPASNTYYVAGKARVTYRRYFSHFDKTVENEEMEAPCPPDQKWIDKQNEEKRRREELLKQNAARKQHDL